MPPCEALAGVMRHNSERLVAGSERRRLLVTEAGWFSHSVTWANPLKSRNKQKSTLLWLEFSVISATTQSDSSILWDDINPSVNDSVSLSVVVKLGIRCAYRCHENRRENLQEKRW